MYLREDVHSGMYLWDVLMGCTYKDVLTRMYLWDVLSEDVDTRMYLRGCRYEDVLREDVDSQN